MHACIYLLHATSACELIVYMNLLHVLLAFTSCHVRSGFMPRAEWFHVSPLSFPVHCGLVPFVCVRFVCIHACVRVGLTCGVSTSTCVYSCILSQHTQYDAEERP